MYVLSGALNVTVHKQMVLQRLTQAAGWHSLPPESLSDFHTHVYNEGYSMHTAALSPQSFKQDHQLISNNN